MSALERATQISREEVMSKIVASGLREYGIYDGLLSERLAAAVTESKEEEKELGVVCALNNADTDGVLLEVLKEDPQKVLEGISIAAYALGCEKKILQIPEYAADMAEALEEKAEQSEVTIVVGLVNVREQKGCALIHIVTARELADYFAEEAVEGIYVSINDEPVKKVSADSKLSELTDCSGAKAIRIGYRYYLPEMAELPLKEVAVTNGLVRILTAKDCIVSETEKKLTAYRKQSCGKCVFCREGLIQLQYIQKEITEGKGKYLELTKEIGEAMTYSTPCSMGQTSALIALSAVENFVSEYTAHIKKKECPAGVCFSTETVYIDPKLCTGCGECMDVCPADCIEGKPKYIHMIDELDCIRCGKCMEVCDVEAIIKTSEKVPKLPNRLTKVGKFKKR